MKILPLLLIATLPFTYAYPLFSEESAKPNAQESAASKRCEPVCTFIPPAGWEMAQTDPSSPYIQVGFVGKGTSQFRPSINLAVEEVDVPLKDYVKAVKQIHLAEPNTKWRDLGKFPIDGGEGRLTEITNSSPVGEIKILQALYVKGETAYILSAAVLKKDLLGLQSQLLKSFQSLKVVPNLASALPEPKQQEELENLFTSLGRSVSNEGILEQMEQLQKTVTQKYGAMGDYWQFLVLKEAYKQIRGPEASPRQN